MASHCWTLVDLLEWVCMFLSGSAQAGPHHALWICSSRFAADLHQRICFFLQICTSGSALFAADLLEQIHTFFCGFSTTDPHFFLQICLSGSALFSANLLVRVHSIFCRSALVGLHIRYMPEPLADSYCF